MIISKPPAPLRASPPVASGHTLAIEYLPLSSVRLWDDNPKLHDLPALQASMRRFGFVAPLVRDGASGRLVAGHGRLAALVALKDAGAPPPARIQVQDGEWLVPVVSGVAFGDDTEASAYALADNRLSDIGGYNDDLLTNVLATLAQADALVGTGWSAKDAMGLLAIEHYGTDRQSRLEELEAQHGSFREEDAWMTIRLSVSAQVYGLFQTLFHSMPGKDDSERLAALMAAASR